MGDMKTLNEQELEGVVGGANNQEFATRKKEFEAAWVILGMDEKGITGNRMAELYDEWEMSGYKNGAAAFLSSVKF